jgi:hypothetical protein
VQGGMSEFFWGGGVSAGSTGNQKPLSGHCTLAGGNIGAQRFSRGLTLLDRHAPSARC